MKINKRKLMRHCVKCLKRATAQEHRFECAVQNCQIWIHSACLKINEQSGNYVKKWVCNAHRDLFRTLILSPISLNNSIEHMLNGNIFEEPLLCEELISNLSQLAISTMADQKCFTCLLDLDGEVYKCFGCEKSFHANCLKSDETLPKDESKLIFLCQTCMKIKYNMRQKENEERRANNNESDNDSDNSDLQYTASETALRGNTERESDIQGACNYFAKMSLHVLPEVVDCDRSWSIFFETFVSTKNKFSHHENVVRIQKAIKNSEIKRIGGKGLFDLKTYETSINYINERLKRNLSTVTSDAKEILKHPRLKIEQYQKIIEFIDKIRNFNYLAEAYNDYSFTRNKMFVSDIADKLPNYIKNKWIDKQYELENGNRPVKLSHLVEVLDKELPKIELRMRNDKMKLDDIKHNKDFKHEKSRFHDINKVDEDNSASNKKFNEKFCWFHKNSSHPSNKCRDLWLLNGRAVAELAKKNERCTYCGQERHFPCPFNKNIKCSLDNCGLKHHALYCYKRNVSDNVEGSSSSSESEAEDNKQDSERFNHIRSQGLYTNTNTKNHSKYANVNHCWHTSSNESSHNHNKLTTTESHNTKVLGVIVIKVENIDEFVERSNVKSDEFQEEIKVSDLHGNEKISNDCLLKVKQLLFEDINNNEVGKGNNITKKNVYADIKSLKHSSTEESMKQDNINIKNKEVESVWMKLLMIWVLIFEIGNLLIVNLKKVLRTFEDNLDISNKVINDAENYGEIYHNRMNTSHSISIVCCKAFCQLLSQKNYNKFIKFKRKELNIRFFEVT
jgi:hypothetical protein